MTASAAARLRASSKAKASKVKVKDALDQTKGGASYVQPGRKRKALGEHQVFEKALVQV